MIVRSPFHRSRFVGNVEGIIGHSICGWVVDRRLPRRRLLVRYDSGDLARAITADRYRADVQTAGLSEDGFCGFAIPIGNAPLTVRLSSAHRPVSIKSDAPAPPFERTHDGSRIYGLVWREGRVSGYAIDRDDPSRHCRLILSDDGGTRRHQVACLFDADAVREGDNDGFHGFRFMFAGRAFRLSDAATGFLIKIRR